VACGIFVLAAASARGQPVAVDVEVREAEKAFFEGNFDRALRRIDSALEEIAQPANQKKMAHSGIDHGIQKIFANALKADILGAIGQHDQAVSLIKSASAEAARKRSTYIRRRINPLGLWLLEAYCELFSGDISFNQGRLGAYRIRYALLDNVTRSSLLELIDDEQSARLMKSAVTWYRKAIDTLENPFATGVKQFSQVSGIDSQQKQNPGTEPNGNGVSLSWDELLAEDFTDVTQRLSCKCFMGLARASVSTMLYEMKSLDRGARAAVTLKRPAEEFSLPDDMEFSKMVQHFEQAYDIPCFVDAEGRDTTGPVPDALKVRFTRAGSQSLLDVLDGALRSQGLCAFASDQGLCICARENKEDFARLQGQASRGVDLQECFDDASGYYARARELFKERRQYRFFVDPQREFALSLKDVMAKATQSQQEGKISRDNMTKLAAAYARTVMEWVLLEQDAAELSGLMSLATETLEQEEERVVQTKALYTRIVDLVRENFSKDHPAVYAASLSASRYRGLLAMRCVEEVRAIRAGERKEREGVTCEQLEVQAEIYREEALETVSELLPAMERSLEVEHPVVLEAVCVLLECVTGGESEDREKYHGEASTLIKKIVAARKSRGSQEN
jgi:tetratricopeptide (TPR) repeat protein